MTLTLGLVRELEQELATEAAHVGPPLAEYAVRVFTQGRLPTAGAELSRTGADTAAFWEREALIGTRSDITDPAEHVRQLREQAQGRFPT